MNTRRAPALLWIDVQQGLDDEGWGRRNNPQAEQRMAELLTAWHRAGWPVARVQHMSQSAAEVLERFHS